MQLRDVEIESTAYTHQAGVASYDRHQSSLNKADLLAALDAAQLVGDRSGAIALIEQIYNAMDVDHVALE